MSNIHFEAYGSAQANTLVMIHGWGMHSGVWRQFARDLSLHCRVICVDLPGHGYSQSLTDFSLANISASLMAVLPATQFSVLGWSLGGMVAIDMASRFPERIKSLVVLAANPKFVAAEDWPGIRQAVLEHFAQQLTLDSQQTLLRFLSLQVQGMANARQLLQEIKQAVLASPGASVDALQAGLSILRDDDLRPAFQALSCPVFVIAGNKDPLVPEALLSAMQELQPKAHCVCLAGAGHVPFLTHQASLLREVLKGL